METKNFGILPATLSNVVELELGDYFYHGTVCRKGFDKYCKEMEIRVYILPTAFKIFNQSLSKIRTIVLMKECATF